MEKEVLFLKCFLDYTEIVYPIKKEKVNLKNNKLLEEECLKHISTLDGRKKAMSKYWGSNYNVPIYICDGICLLKINGEYLINVCNVTSVINEMIIFNNGFSINITSCERNIKNKIKRILSILKNKKN